MFVRSRQTGFSALAMRAEDHCIDSLEGPEIPGTDKQEVAYVLSADGKRAYPIRRASLGLFQGLQRMQWQMLMRYRGTYLGAALQTNGVLDQETLRNAKMIREIIVELSRRGELEATVTAGGGTLIGFNRTPRDVKDLAEGSCFYIGLVDRYILKEDTSIDPVGDLPKLPMDVVIPPGTNPDQGMPRPGPWLRLSRGTKLFGLGLVGGIVYVLLKKRKRS